MIIHQVFGAWQNQTPSLPASAGPRSLDAPPIQDDTIVQLSKSLRKTLADDGAHAIAATTGLTEAQATQITQPLRSPPPAKGAALLMAQLLAEPQKTTFTEL